MTSDEIDAQIIDLAPAVLADFTTGELLDELEDLGRDPAGRGERILIIRTEISRRGHPPEFLRAARVITTDLNLYMSDADVALIVAAVKGGT